MGIPLIKTVIDSYRFAIQNLGGIFFLGLPFIVAQGFLMWSAGELLFTTDANWQYRIIVDYILMILLVPVAMSVHRAIILDENYDTEFWANLLSLRSLKFLALLLIPSIMADAASFAFKTLAPQLSILNPSILFSMVSMFIVFVLACCYVGVRLSVALPLIAIEASQPIKGALLATKNHFWKLFLLTFLSVLPPMACIFLITYATMMSEQINWGLQSGFPNWLIAFTILLNVIAVISVAIMAATISYFMKYRREQDPSIAAATEAERQFS